MIYFALTQPFTVVMSRKSDPIRLPLFASSRWPFAYLEKYDQQEVIFKSTCLGLVFRSLNLIRNSEALDVSSFGAPEV